MMQVAVLNIDLSNVVIEFTGLKFEIYGNNDAFAQELSRAWLFLTPPINSPDFGTQSLEPQPRSPHVTSPPPSSPPSLALLHQWLNFQAFQDHPQAWLCAVFRTFPSLNHQRSKSIYCNAHHVLIGSSVLPSLPSDW